MAIFSSVLAPAGAGQDLTASIGTTTSSAEILLTAYQYFAICANQDINIRFGPTGVSAASASDFRIPANTIAIYPVSKQNPALRIFNPDASTSVTYWIQRLVAQV